MKANITNMAVQDIVIMMREWNEQTQKEFTQAMNKSLSTITKIETANRNLYLHDFLAWCKKSNIKIIMEKK